MANEHSGISRRKLLYTAAIGVPAVGAVAMGATLITAPASNAAMIAAGDPAGGVMQASRMPLR